jgi:hypothetical protein
MKIQDQTKIQKTKMQDSHLWPLKTSEFSPNWSEEVVGATRASMKLLNRLAKSRCNSNPILKGQGQPLKT